jgi:amino acid adenylation domain-containing protein
MRWPSDDALTGAPPTSIDAGSSFQYRVMAEDLLLILLVCWVAKPSIELIYMCVWKAFEYLSLCRSRQQTKTRPPGDCRSGATSTPLVGNNALTASKKQSTDPGNLASSPLQDPFLSWQMVHPKGVAFNEGLCFWIERELGAEILGDVLRRALWAVLLKHEALRMKFAPDSNGKWMQQPLPLDLLFPLVFQETEASDETQALLLAEKALHTPLQIFDGICVRACAIRCSPSKILFYVVQHHAVTDAVSIALFYKELADQYRILAGTLPLDLLPPQPQHGYSIVAASQRRKAVANCHEKNLHWWQHHLQGAPLNGSPAKLDLPSDQPQAVKPSFEAFVSKFNFTIGLSDGIQRLAKDEHTTVFDVLLALHSAWLCTMSHQEEILVWSSHHGRTSEVGADGMLGCFRTDLALKLSLDPRSSFRNYLQVCAKEKKEAMLHWDMPPGELYRLAGADGSGFESGQTILNYYSDRYHMAGMNADAAKHPFSDGIDVRPVFLQKRATTADVQCDFMKDASGRLCGHAVFAADRFSQALADRMTGHFINFAAAVIEDAGGFVRSMPLFATGQEQDLERFHGPNAAACLPTAVELLNQCVAVAPGNVAVEYEATGEQLSYADLAARSRGLAAHLSSLGTVPDTMVAIMLERSVEMVVAIHAVWVACCAYAPLDLNAPNEYHQTIATDISTHNAGLHAANGVGSVPCILLTQSWLQQSRSTDESCDLFRGAFSHVLYLNEFKPRLAVGLPCSKPCSSTLPSGQNLAYCIYTSGSTGRPKGVLLQHQGLSNYIHACDRKMESMTQQDIMLQRTPYIFDVSLYEFATPLLAAAKLLVLKHEMHKDADYVCNAVTRCRVTRARFVPSYFDLFLDVARARPGSMQTLRCVGCSGEALLPETVRSSLQLLPEMTLYDLYGPTEATVDVTLLHCTSECLRPGKKTIGRALAGVNAYIVAPFEKDEEPHLRLMPVGLHGELLIGGCQLARGYLNLPKQTAAAFITNPFNKSSRLYCTGDLAKWLPDGQVVYCGRLDRQVKLNGLRIELGAIENAAIQADGVSEAVAKMNVDATNGRSQLVVYIAPKAAATTHVLAHCRKLLPAFMVPSVVIGLDEWPRTASGKIDSKQLPAPLSSVAPPRCDDERGLDVSDQELHNMGMLVAKIKSKGVIGAMGDEEVQERGWNSFQVMRAHVDLLNNPDKYCSKHSGVTAEIGVISIVGHIWIVMMHLVVLEWVVAYWEWYSAVPSVSGRFTVSSYPILQHLNAVGRLCGDPVFVLLSGIQDMSDVRDGKTSALCRRMVLFCLICVTGTVIDKVILQGPYVRYGWVNAAWALDTNRTCGVLNGAIFIAARTFFMLFAIFLSMGRCGWIRIGGFIEWPWACIALALLTPAVVEGVTPVRGFGDGSFLQYMQGCKDFIVELSPYYFIYPLFTGGTKFPHWIASKKVQLSWRGAVALQTFGLMIVVLFLRWLGIENTHDVDVLQGDHVVWSALLHNLEPSRGEWPLLRIMEKCCDLYAAAALGVLTISFALIAPSTPTAFSLLGTRVIGAYLAMPLTIIPAGHFLVPKLLDMPASWRPVFVPLGVIGVLMLCTMSASQQIVPECLLRWADEGTSLPTGWLEGLGRIGRSWFRLVGGTESIPLLSSKVRK